MARATDSLRSQLKADILAQRRKVYKDTGLVKYAPKEESGGEYVDESRLIKILPDLERYLELWLAYPDKMYEWLYPTDTGFHFYPFQKLGLRANLRFKQTFQTATRGYSKSFMAFSTKIAKCILIPRTKETIIANTKNQAARIGREKIGELERLMPGITNEIDRSRGSGTTQKDDYFRIHFKNGSELDVSSLMESGRGGRRFGILFEEMKDLPADPVNEIALPLLNISRRMYDGSLNPNEPHHQTTWIGSAGYVGSFAHDKCIETTMNAILYPHNYFSWGGTYKIPIHYGLLSDEFVQNLRDAGTYDESSFSREFLSRWTHSVEGSLFDYERLNKLRKVKKAEWKRSSDNDVFYIGSLDVARHSARTIFIVFKVKRGQDGFLISVVNIVPMEGRNFAYQTEKIKELDEAFDFDSIIIDANGLTYSPLAQQCA